MKIISWNLRNVSLNKISNGKDYKLSPVFINYGLGNSILDCIVRLATGNAQWDNIPDLSTNPADVFVITELKTSGSTKGKNVYGKCIPTLKKILAAMNEAVSSQKDKYVYDYVIPPDTNNDNGPQITGRYETVGVIYNTKTLKYTSASVLYNVRDSTLNSTLYLQKKTPYAAKFEFLSAPGTYMQVVGIHAPPLDSKKATDRRDPIQFCNLLPLVGSLWTNYAEMANTLFMGDFNCNAADSYTGYETYTVNGSSKRRRTEIYPFTGLTNLGYTTHLANDALSSLADDLSTGATAPYKPADYLVNAFDNILMNGPAAAKANTAKELIVNTIGYSRNMNAGKVLLVDNKDTTYATANCVVTAFGRVSDHLPAVIEW